MKDGYEFTKVTIYESEKTNGHTSYRIMGAIDPENGIQYEWTIREKSAILSRLDDVSFYKVMKCTTTKEFWEKLNRIYEGDEKVKKAKFQTFSV